MKAPIPKRSRLQFRPYYRLHMPLHVHLNLLCFCSLSSSFCGFEEVLQVWDIIGKAATTDSFTRLN